MATRMYLFPFSVFSSAPIRSRSHSSLGDVVLMTLFLVLALASPTVEDISDSWISVSMTL